MGELTGAQRRALEATGSEVRTDLLTRCLYAVDASIYRVEPAAVAFPRTARQAAQLLAAAADAGVEITPRGAGSGLTGGALGGGLVVDFARHNRDIGDFDPDRRSVRVGAGVVLDQLNGFLAPHGLWFGPDVATASRATLGGMIANNSSGAHAPVYGTTADHVLAVEVVAADGTVATVGRDHDDLAEIRDGADRIIAAHADAIRRRMPPGLVKRWPGYGLDRALRATGDLTQLVAGSEGTLVGVVSAVLRVVPKPSSRSLGVLFFSSVEDALSTTVELADLGAAAIEHIDRWVLDQTVGQRAFAPARALLGLDDAPSNAILLVEIFDDRDDRLAALESRRLGDRRLLLRDGAEQELVWAMRRAGLSLLTGRKGPAKPVGFIEDVCVRPHQLPDYVAGLREILDPLGLAASFYGHAASGELHVRPILDLHRPEDVAALRRVADEVSHLCRRFNGSLAAEHGVGIVRTGHLEEHLGAELMEASRHIKELFDPGGVMNPGKIIPDGRFRVDGDLRLGPRSTLRLPFDEGFTWAGRDDGFIANLEQCNGCGGCRKAAPTMCPTFAATGDEALSTRGRATIIRAALEGRFEGSDSITGAEIGEVLASCLSCKACTTECPSNVNMAQLKAELLNAWHREQGIRAIDRLISAADLLGRFGTTLPRLANILVGWRPLRLLAQRALGLAADAPLPRFADQRFDRWFAGRRTAVAGDRPRVILWDDTWVRYHEPAIGQAAVEVLEALGYEVGLAEGRVCCGRPAASRGVLGKVRAAAAHNVPLLAATNGPIVFLEPSCWSMFRDEYRQLGVPGADDVADRCVLIEELVLGILEDDPGALPAAAAVGEVAVHGHCHAEALGEARIAVDLIGRLPGASVRRLDTGCCGMAGAFGMMEHHRELSRRVARPLVEAIEGLPPGTSIVASGTSCRHQISDLTAARPLHIAEVLARTLTKPL